MSSSLVRLPTRCRAACCAQDRARILAHLNGEPTRRPVLWRPAAHRRAEATCVAGCSLLPCSAALFFPQNCSIYRAWARAVESKRPVAMRASGRQFCSRRLRQTPQPSRRAVVLRGSRSGRGARLHHHLARSSRAPAWRGLGWCSVLAQVIRESRSVRTIPT
jgi:hypothetical protein